MKITGAVRPGNEFQLTVKPTSLACSTFAAILPDEIKVTRRLADILTLPDDVLVIAHWHGEWHTDAFATTVKELKDKAAARNA